MCSRNRKSGGSGARVVIRSSVRDGGGRPQRWPLICLLSVVDLRVLDVSYKQACAMSPFGSGFSHWASYFQGSSTCWPCLVLVYRLYYPLKRGWVFFSVPFFLFFVSTWMRWKLPATGNADKIWLENLLGFVLYREVDSHPPHSSHLINIFLLNHVFGIHADNMNVTHSDM